ncbi:hypothetical protein AQUCO_03700292v1 [Aquilegia coerulea]|uniref:Uncharacterized protein n=1 Tax=Aquilegia coerulea TaxID=218851 RepID=A0A2G5CVJ7_AQUCA|nr:hypothetical protein AQUCO_03700292v1 [Aquilegia coerulea]
MEVGRTKARVSWDTKPHVILADGSAGPFSAIYIYIHCNMEAVSSAAVAAAGAVPTLRSLNTVETFGLLIRFLVHCHHIIHRIDHTSFH